MLHLLPKPIGAAPPPAPPSYDARQLTNAGSTAHLVLDNQIYTLRITRAGKLILTK
jgi:hypothetical protein